MNKAILWSTLFLITSLLSCKKSELTDEGLTECNTCEYTYRKEAKLEGFRVENGNALVFTYTRFWGMDTDGPYDRLSIEVPPGNTSFTYGKKEITGNKVAYHSVCIYCNMILVEAVDGLIRGKQLDSHRWLIEANVILGSPHSDYKDTLSFKQYFTPVSGTGGN